MCKPSRALLPRRGLLVLDRNLQAHVIKLYRAGKAHTTTGTCVISGARIDVFNAMGAFYSTT